jgi:hypothetical protein
MSDLSPAIHNIGHYHVRPRPVCLSPSCARSANNGHGRRSTCTWLRSIWRHVTHARLPKIRRIDCNELARNLLPGCLVWFLSDRSLAKACAGTAGGNRRPSDGKIKAAMCGRSVSIVSTCLHIVFEQPATAPPEVRGTASTRKAIRNQGSPRHCAHLALSVRLIERLRAMTARSEPLPDNRRPVKARAMRDRLRRLTALTGLQLPGCLPPSDHGLT